MAKTAVEDERDPERRLTYFEARAILVELGVIDD